MDARCAMKAREMPAAPSSNLRLSFKQWILPIRSLGKAEAVMKRRWSRAPHSGQGDVYRRPPTPASTEGLEALMASIQPPAEGVSQSSCLQETPVEGVASLVGWGDAPQKGTDGTLTNGFAAARDVMACSVPIRLAGLVRPNP